MKFNKKPESSMKSLKSSFVLLIKWIIQANSLERTLWSITGDSEAAFHERQSISFQVNQLQQEADWQANAADAQATAALHSLSIPVPDLYTGTDRASMTAALVQYLKSKEPDYLPDDIREQAAMQDFNMLYADLPDDVLAARIQDIVDSEKQAQHFQQEIFKMEIMIKMRSSMNPAIRNMR